MSAGRSPRRQWGSSALGGPHLFVSSPAWSGVWLSAVRVWSVEALPKYAGQGVATTQMAATGARATPSPGRTEPARGAGDRRCRSTAYLPEFATRPSAGKPGQQQPDRVAAAVVAYDVLAHSRGQQWHVVSPVEVSPARPPGQDPPAARVDASPSELDRPQRFHATRLKQPAGRCSRRSLPSQGERKSWVGGPQVSGRTDLRARRSTDHHLRTSRVSSA